jgi:hypothetical protein
MLTSKDFTNTTYKQYGFKNPNNNLGAMANRLSFPLYDRAMQGQNFANELDPQRQGAIRAMVANNNPANMVANAQAQGGRVFNQSVGQGQTLSQMLAMRGGNQGTQLGAIAQGQNQGTEAANNLLLNAYSPEAQNNALAAMIQATDAAPGNALLQLLGLAGPITQKEHDRMARSQGQGLSGIAGMLGQLAGGMDWTSLLTPGPNPAILNAVNSAKQGIY